MIEPPGQFRRRTVFEIHDGVFIAIEIAVIKQGSGAMHHRLKNLFPVGVNILAVKPPEDGGG
jgi:hypothetical protein